MGHINSRSHVPRRVAPQATLPKFGSSTAAPVDPYSPPPLNSAFEATYLDPDQVLFLNLGSGNGAYVWHRADSGGLGRFTEYPSAECPGQHYGAMCWDGSKVILLVDEDLPTPLVKKTYTWNGSGWDDITTGNEPLPSTNGGPNAAGGSHPWGRMAYDPTHGKVVLFLGCNVGFGPNQTWLWDGSDWTNAAPATNPSDRLDVALGWDGTQVIMFGGWRSGPTVLSQTWKWTGTNWVQLTPATTPNARRSAMIEWDGASGALMSFGTDVGGSTFTDAWHWNGTDWSNVSPSTVPSGLGQYAFDGAFDAAELFVAVNGHWSPGFSYHWARWTGTDWEPWTIGAF